MRTVQLFWTYRLFFVIMKGKEKFQAIKTEGDIMAIRELGEFGLIDVIQKNTIFRPESVVVGIGDDAAAIRPPKDKLELFATDMLVEDIHFTLNTIRPHDLGYKTIAVNLSDIAAMGGRPTQVVISMALRPDLDTSFVTEMYQGMREICSEFGVNLVGGDTVSTRGPIVLNCAVLGEVAEPRLQRRSGARVGDWVAVTNTLGDSSAGCELLLKRKDAYTEAEEKLIKAHVKPRPQVELAKRIAEYATSMNDVSDGLASESNELAKAGQVCIRIDKDKIPLSDAMRKVSLEKEKTDYALYGGEDYQLIFTMPPTETQELIDREITVIGEVIVGEAGVFLAEGGRQERLFPKGYQHF